MITWTQQFMQQLITNELSTVVAGNFTGALVGTKIALFTNNPVMAPTLLFAGLTEPLYTGYAEKVITWSPAFANADGSLGIQGTVPYFQPTGGVPNDTIQGYGLILPGTPNVLYGAEYFSNPVGLQSLLAILEMSLNLNFGSQNLGGATLIQPVF